ncbi:hypothetical protein RHMOL_Rhmol13G0058800 [Rhododendron molle]|uniref:Uncharacterized protein n=1 Tax=Rhododendron molle TaxID=49168 RepID=A0ACC0L3D9_RHOML|nr:hypothetical protein RHMOL_Rhmol13G0058800 [Rhododendron molle]
MTLNGFDVTLMVLKDRRIDTKDLRFKLQKKSILQAIHSGSGSVSAVRDLREKLSGSTYSLPLKSDPPKPKTKANPKPKPLLEGSRKSVIVEAPESETKKVASSIPKKKTQQKAESVDSFLQSLGLEKYSITFQAEEVDMTALVHMADEDLKALGIPMTKEACFVLFSWVQGRRYFWHWNLKSDISGWTKFRCICGSQCFSSISLKSVGVFQPGMPLRRTFLG